MEGPEGIPLVRGGVEAIKKSPQFRVLIAVGLFCFAGWFVYEIVRENVYRVKADLPIQWLGILIAVAIAGFPVMLAVLLTRTKGARPMARPKEVDIGQIGGMITQYDAYFVCDECSETHWLGVSVGLSDGPIGNASIGETYAGRDLPPQVAELIGHEIICPNTEKLTSQADDKKVFIAVRS